MSHWPAFTIYSMTKGLECWRLTVGSSNTSALCPDLLRYEQIGEADGWRGRVVRAFFWIMRLWP